MMKYEPSTTNHVLLIHGLGGSRLDMWPIARRLTRSRFQVINWGYRSFGNSIDKLADRLETALSNNKQQQTAHRVDVVTHSMGGIILRVLLNRTEIANLGRVVMLAPPHRGSHTARWLARYIGWATPSLKQISDEPDSYVNKLANPFIEQDIEFGIVVAGKDRVIAPDCVELAGYRDKAIVNGHHGILTWYSKTQKLVEDFLLHGRFQAKLPTNREISIRPTSAELLTGIRLRSTPPKAHQLKQR